MKEFILVMTIIFAALMWWLIKGMIVMAPFFWTKDYHEFNRKGVLLMMPPPADVLVLVYALYCLIERAIMIYIPEALKEFDEKWRRVK